MRAYIPDYEIISPKTLAEALNKLAAEPGVWKLFAGGTDLMVLLEAGQLTHKKFLNIWGLEELRKIRKTSKRISIGALTTYSEIRKSPTLSREFPLLARAAGETGAIAIQNRGTLGGNIANASPAADTPPALLVYDAELELISSRGTRRVPYAHFHTGYKKTAMRPDELVYRIHLNRDTQGLFHYYRKVGTRKAQAISKVCFAGVLGLEKGVVRHARISLGSVAATPLRLARIETALQGQRLTEDLVAELRAILSREIAPLDDIRSTKEYRLRVAGNLLAEFLAQAGR